MGEGGTWGHQTGEEGKHGQSHRPAREGRRQLFDPLSPTASDVTPVSDLLDPPPRLPLQGAVVLPRIMQEQGLPWNLLNFWLRRHAQILR